MEGVIGQFVLYINIEHATEGYADDESKNVDDGERSIPGEGPESDFDVVVEHGRIMGLSREVKHLAIHCFGPYLEVSRNRNVRK